jgi:hypothetical protein
MASEFCYWIERPWRGAFCEGLVPRAFAGYAVNPKRTRDQESVRNECVRREVGVSQFVGVAESPNFSIAGDSASESDLAAVADDNHFKRRRKFPAARSVNQLPHLGNQAANNRLIAD